MNAEFLDQIDQAILASCTTRWQKTAMLLGRVDEVLSSEAELDTFDLIADRVAALVQQGRLEAVGDLAEWRASEIRLSGSIGD